MSPQRDSWRPAVTMAVRFGSDWIEARTGPPEGVLDVGLGADARVERLAHAREKQCDHEAERRAEERVADRPRARLHRGLGALDDRRAAGVERVEDLEAVQLAAELVALGAGDGVERSAGASSWAWIWSIAWWIA